MDRSVRLDCEEDNQAALSIAQSGKNPNIRDMGRTHGVCAAWLNERFAERPEWVTARYCDTAEMAADLMKKPFADAVKWAHAVGLVGLSRTPKAKVS